MIYVPFSLLVEFMPCHITEYIGSKDILLF